MGNGNHLGSGSTILTSPIIPPRIGVHYWNSAAWKSPIAGLSTNISGNPTVSSSYLPELAPNDYLRSTALQTAFRFNRQNASGFISGRPHLSFLGCLLFGVDLNSSISFNLFTHTGMGSNPTMNYSVAINNGASTVAALPRCQPTVIGLVTNGSSSGTIYFDGVSVGVGGATGTGSVGAGGYGMFGSPQVSFDQLGGDFLAFALYNSSLSSPQAAAVSSALLPSQPTATRNVVFNGDSITSGYYASYGQNPPKQAEALVNNPVTMYNLGVPSILATSLIAADHTMGPLLFNAAMAKNIYHWWGGTNDIAAGGAGSGSTLWTNVLAHLTYMKDLGIRSWLAHS